MKILKIKQITALFYSLVAFAGAGTNPIIFIHGQKGAAGENQAKPYWAWQDWNGRVSSKPYRSAMDRILMEHYGGYSAGYLTNGDSIDCDINSSLASTGGNTKKIYNFSFYHPDGDAGVISLSEGMTIYVSHGWNLDGDYAIFS